MIDYISDRPNASSRETTYAHLVDWGGRSGTAALRQLQKNPTLQVIVSDTIARPRAVAERVIARVDYVEQVTSANVNQLARRVRAELILLDASASQRNLRQLSEGQVFAEALDAELAVASTVPCLIL